MKAKVWFGSVIGGTLLVLAAFAGYIYDRFRFFIFITCGRDLPIHWITAAIRNDDR